MPSMRMQVKERLVEDKKITEGGWFNACGNLKGLGRANKQ